MRCSVHCSINNIALHTYVYIQIDEWPASKLNNVREKKREHTHIQINYMKKFHIHTQKIEIDIPQSC